MLKHEFFTNFIKYSLIGFSVGVFISLNIFIASSFTEPTGAPGVTEPTDENSRGAIHTLLGVTNSVTNSTTTIFNFLREVYTNVGGTPSSVSGYTLDGGGVNDLIGTSTPDTANGKTAFNYLKLIDDTLDFPITSSVLSSDTIKGVSGDISDCTGGDASCYANSGAWSSAECVDSTTATTTNCYIDDTAKYVNADACSATSDTGYCYVSSSTLDNMDSDLVASNIKNGEVVFGLTGTFVPRGGGSQASAGIDCSQIKTSYASSADGTYWIDPNGGDTDDAFEVYCDMTTDSGGWTLVMKLAAGNFCYGSSKWTDGNSYNSTDTLTATAPTRDSKNDAFSNLNFVSELRFETVSSEVTTTFAGTTTPQELITTNNVDFAVYPNYTNWVATFYQGRSSGPIFMRAGAVVTDPAGCRTNPASTPLGCGQPCTFCYQASDGGSACGTASANDTNSGIGNNVNYCGAGTATCSTGGLWSNTANKTIIWAR